ncbi:MAG: septum formation initiator family protein [Gracilibacteraceae bacterium]|jgi:cell division protein DivIC|nr:septum formation initiator family protein [Gracilibacteraceae bacterium]
MARRSRSKSKKRGFGNIGVRFVSVVVILTVSFITWQWMSAALQKNQAASDQLQALSREKEQLEQVQANLREEIENLQTPSYIEELAREHLGLVRKGEILVAPREGE